MMAFQEDFLIMKKLQFIIIPKEVCKKKNKETDIEKRSSTKN